MDLCVNEISFDSAALTHYDLVFTYFIHSLIYLFIYIYLHKSTHWSTGDGAIS